MSKHEDAIAEGAAGLLEPGEQIVSALVVSPRGATTAAAAGLGASEIGRRWSAKNASAAADLGLVVKRSCALVLTDRRVMTLDLGISVTGAVKEVKGLLSELPLDQVDEVSSKWNVMTISGGESRCKVECKPPAAKAFAKAFASSRAEVR